MNTENKEQLGKEAARQYEKLERLWDRFWHPPGPIKPDPYRSERDLRRIEGMRRDAGHRLVDDLCDTEQEAKQFYKEHHAELYDLAKEEMEADGKEFSEGDPYKVTEYYYGKEIADLQRESPLNALGAIIVHIGETHMELVEQELGHNSPQ